MKKQIIISIIVLVLIISVIGIGLYFSLKNPALNLVTQTTCAVTNTGVTNTNSYPCPSGKTCEISVTLNCNTKVSEPAVIFRTNAQVINGRTYTSSTDLKSVYENKWIAVDTSNSGALNGFKYKDRGTRTPCVSPTSSIIVKNSDGTNMVTKDGLTVTIWKSSQDIFLCSPSNHYVSFSQDITSTDIVKSVSQTEPYKSNNQELLDGNTNTFQCSQSVTDQTGKILKTISDSRSTTWTKTEKVSLTGGQTAKWTGTINYTETEIKNSECIPGKNFTDSSNANKYYSCIPDANGCGKKGTTYYCTPSSYVYNEDNQKCVPPYEVIVTIDKTSISLGEKFTINFDLNDPSGKQIRDLNVIATLYSGNTPEDSDSLLTDINGKAKLYLEPKSTGFRTIKIEMTHPSGDYDNEYSVTVSEPLTITTFKTQQVQYDNDLIQVKVESNKNGQPIDFSDYVIETQYIKGGITTNPSPERAEHITASGTYFFKYKLTGEGVLRFRIKAKESLGAWTAFTSWIEVQVKKARVLFTDLNIINDKCEGSYTNSFKITDSYGNPIDDATVNILVKSSYGQSNANPIQKGNGIISFTYAFTKADLYTVFVTAIKGDLQGEITDGIPVNILNCDGGGDDGFCATHNCTLYMVVGIVIIGIAGFSWLVFFRRKK